MLDLSQVLAYKHLFLLKSTIEKGYLFLKAREHSPRKPPLLYSDSTYVPDNYCILEKQNVFPVNDCA